MNWNTCKNILCIRADNMGDVIMSTPAFRALKESFGCRLTLLTSAMGSLITPFIKEIDQTITVDLPWIKTNNSVNAESCFELIEKLKAFHFDAAVIFTVYSQNPLPSALIAYLASIPLRLAYCRENPYGLLTDWVADKEPYTFIQHQVKRDLCLVENVGATTDNERLSVAVDEHAFIRAARKLNNVGVDLDAEFIIAHPGVSDAKRLYPEALWIEALNLITQQTNVQVLLTGAKSEQELTQRIQRSVNGKVFSTAEFLTLEESIALIAHASLVISVNTSTVHIAAALQKPVVVLYAETNPQHTPWLTKKAVLCYSVPEKLRSKNEVIQFVNQSYYKEQISYPSPEKVANAVLKMMATQFHYYN